MSAQRKPGQFDKQTATEAINRRRQLHRARQAGEVVERDVDAIMGVLVNAAKNGDVAAARARATRVDRDDKGESGAAQSR
jgi:hypothetical protein